MSKTAEQIYGEHYHKWEHSNNELSTHIIEAMQEFSTQELAAFKERLKKGIKDEGQGRTRFWMGEIFKLIDQN